MDATEILKLLKPKIALMKGQGNPIPYSRKRELPKYNPVYATCVHLREKIEIHTEFGKIPEDMISRRGPFEDDMQYKYRVDNWESTTMPYWSMALSQLNRIMVPTNYSVQWTDKQSEEARYFSKEIPLIENIDTYFREIVIEQKIIDPNSLLVVKPFYIPVLETEIEGRTSYIYNDREKVRPVPVIVDCKRVLDYIDGEFAIIVLLENSEVKVGEKTEKEGIIFEIYDIENIWRVEQIGKKEDFQFSDPILYYSHKLGKLPCKKLKGYPKQKDKAIFYESYFISAVPNSNIALFSHSQLDLSSTTQMFPQRSELTDTCDDPMCKGQGWWEEYRDDKKVRTECGTCHGTGRRSRVGPMQTKQLNIPDGYNPTDNSQMPAPPGIWYTAPPAEPLKFVFDKIKYDVYTAFSFLNIDVTNSKVKGSETALGKQIDREAFFSFLMRISGEVFSLYEYTIDCMGKMRYGAAFMVPKIAEPTSFQIRTESDLTEEIAEGKKAGLPDIIMRQLTRELMSKRFSSIENIEDIVNLVFAVDKFVTFNTVEINTRLANGTAHKWQAILHDSIYAYLELLQIEDKDFFTKDFEYQKNALIEKAKKEETELKETSIVKVEDIAVDE